MQSTILLLGDITGRSRVAVRMLNAELEARGHETLILPTAMISNTLNLGKFQVLDTSDYLFDSLKTWKELGLHWDFVYIGYITGMEQAKRLAEFAAEMKEAGIPVLVDPILGDDGRRYNGVREEQVEGMRLLCRYADYVTPNLTEGCMLTGADYPRAAAGDEDAIWELMDSLTDSSKRSIIVTSARTSDGTRAVIGFDLKTEEQIWIPYDPIPGRYFGTGDLFSAVLIDALTRNLSLDQAAREATNCVRTRIRKAEANKS